LLPRHAAFHALDGDVPGFSDAQQQMQGHQQDNEPPDDELLHDLMRKICAGKCLLFLNDLGSST